MIWLLLGPILALVAVAYAAWVMLSTRDIVLRSRLVCQRCGLSTVIMYIRTEELVDGTLLAVEHLKMLSEDLRD